MAFFSQGTLRDRISSISVQVAAALLVDWANEDKLMTIAVRRAPSDALTARAVLCIEYAQIVTGRATAATRVDISTFCARLCGGGLHVISTAGNLSAPQVQIRGMDDEGVHAELWFSFSAPGAIHATAVPGVPAWEPRFVDGTAAADMDLRWGDIVGQYIAATDTVREFTPVTDDVVVAARQAGGAITGRNVHTEEFFRESLGRRYAPGTPDTSITPPALAAAPEMRSIALSDGPDEPSMRSEPPAEQTVNPRSLDEVAAMLLRAREGTERPPMEERGGYSESQVGGGSLPDPTDNEPTPPQRMGADSFVRTVAHRCATFIVSPSGHVLDVMYNGNAPIASSQLFEGIYCFNIPDSATGGDYTFSETGYWRRREDGEEGGGRYIRPSVVRIAGPPVTPVTTTAQEVRDEVRVYHPDGVFITDTNGWVIRLHVHDHITQPARAAMEEAVRFFLPNLRDHGFSYSSVGRWSRVGTFFPAAVLRDEQDDSTLAQDIMVIASCGQFVITRGGYVLDVHPEANATPVQISHMEGIYRFDIERSSTSHGYAFSHVGRWERNEAGAQGQWHEAAISGNYNDSAIHNSAPDTSATLPYQRAWVRTIEGTLLVNHNGLVLDTYLNTIEVDDGGAVWLLAIDSIDITEYVVCYGDPAAIYNIDDVGYWTSPRYGEDSPTRREYHPPVAEVRAENQRGGYVPVAATLQAPPELQLPERPTGHSTVHSSSGDLWVNNVSGQVVHLFPADETGSEYLNQITRVDLAEYQACYGETDSEYDILDLGVWDGDGGNTYTPPDANFRESHNASPGESQITRGGLDLPLAEVRVRRGRLIIDAFGYVLDVIGAAADIAAFQGIARVDLVEHHRRNPHFIWSYDGDNMAHWDIDGTYWPAGSTTRRPEAS